MEVNVNDYTNNDILDLFYIHGECGRIVQRTCRLFNEKHPHLPPMSKTKFRRIESNFRRIDMKLKKSVPKPVTSNELNEINVLGYFNAYRHASIAAASSDLGISFSSIQRILRKHKMHPYSFIILHELRPGDNMVRIQFCEFILTKTQEDPLFLNKIIWTDESKFTREGITNRRNLHIWSEENPHAVRQAHFQSRFGFNVFAIIMGDKVAYEIYDENLTSENYLHLLRTTLSAFLDDLPLNELGDCWYQLDGAPAHSTREVYLELSNTFGDRWIGRNGPWNWPARSPDLTPVDFFLWGYIKNKVYNQNIHTREELINKVQTAFRDLTVDREMLRRATVNETYRRILKCLEEDGRHIEHL